MVSLSNTWHGYLWCVLADGWLYEFISFCLRIFSGSILLFLYRFSWVYLVGCVSFLFCFIALGLWDFLYLSICSLICFFYILLVHSLLFVIFLMIFLLEGDYFSSSKMIAFLLIPQSICFWWWFLICTAICAIWIFIFRRRLNVVWRFPFLIFTWGRQLRMFRTRLFPNAFWSLIEVFSGTPWPQEQY